MVKYVSTYTKDILKNQQRTYVIMLMRCFCVFVLFVCVEVLRPSQPNGVMSSAVSLPNHTFTGQA